MQEKNEVHPSAERAFRAMRISRRRFLQIGGAGLAGATLLGATGCGVFGGGQGGGNGGGGGGKKVFNMYEGADIPDLNSTTTTDAASFSVLVNCMEGLYRLDENEEPVPAMASDVKVSDDKLTYTFTLRDGVKWSNGDPVTSEDFKYAWTRAIDPETAGQYAFIISDFIQGGPEFASGDGSADDLGIEAPDDKTLKTTLIYPTPFFLGLTAFATYFPQQKKFVEDQGKDFAQGADTLLYNGPYKITEFDAASKVTFEKNDGYWDKGNVDLDTINVRVVKDLKTVLNLYEGDQIDFARLEGEDVERFKDSPDLEQVIEFTTFYLQFNQENEVMANKNIREAIARGYDKESYVNTLLAGGSVPGTNGLVPPEVAGPGDQTFREFSGDVVPDFDPKAAKEFYQKGVEELGQEPTLELLSQDSSVAREESQFLQSQLQENLGAKVNIVTKPFDAFLDATEKGNYQMSASGWGADYNDPSTFLDLFVSDGAFNDPAFSNDQYDKLMADAKTEADPKKRMEFMKEAEKILLQDEVVLSPNYHRKKSVLIKPFVKKTVIHPFGAEFDYKYWKADAKS